MLLFKFNVFMVQNFTRLIFKEEENYCENIFLDLGLGALAKCVGYVRRNGAFYVFEVIYIFYEIRYHCSYAMSRLEYWMGRLVVLFIAVIPYAVVRIFQNKEL